MSSDLPKNGEKFNIKTYFHGNIIWKVYLCTIIEYIKCEICVFTIKMSYSYFLFCQVVQHLYVLDPIQSSKMYEMPINMKSELFPLAFVRN